MIVREISMIGYTDMDLLIKRFYPDYSYDYQHTNGILRIGFKNNNGIWMDMTMWAYIIAE